MKYYYLINMGGGDMSTNYEDFNPNDPYAESNEFKPAFV